MDQLEEIISTQGDGLVEAADTLFVVALSYKAAYSLRTVHLYQ